MKIVKIGNDQQIMVWEGTCNHCSSTMQEIHTKLNPVYDESDGPVAYGSCPVCNHGFKLFPIGKYINEMDDWYV